MPFPCAGARDIPRCVRCRGSSGCDSLFAVGVSKDFQFLRIVTTNDGRNTTFCRVQCLWHFLLKQDLAHFTCPRVSIINFIWLGSPGTLAPDSAINVQFLSSVFWVGKAGWMRVQQMSVIAKQKHNQKQPIRLEFSTKWPASREWTREREKMHKKSIVCAASPCR